jgi:hypothetical protein
MAQGGGQMKSHHWKFVDFPSTPKRTIQACIFCGIVKRALGNNNRCPGKVKVTFRRKAAGK